MSKALVVIDIQNDITKNYREIIDKIKGKKQNGRKYNFCSNGK